MKSNLRLAVLGAGSWGATLANMLAEKNDDVRLWEFDTSAASKLALSRQLAILPDLRLLKTVQVTNDLAYALSDRDVIVSATPSHVVRATMRSVRISGALAPASVVVSVSKGLEEKTGKRMSQVIDEELHCGLDRIAVLGGPSHAEEVCRQLPTATVIACSDAGVSSELQTLLTKDYFRVYAHADVVGVELSGALKNVYAIACGISDGLGFGDNTRAAILTRGLNEMTRLGAQLGAQILTFFGLAGMGDLVVTCMSPHSRNHTFGAKIGSGQTPAQALSEMTMVAEGYKTASSAYQLAQRLGFDAPLTHEIYQVLYEGKNPRFSLRDLMIREPHREWEGLTISPEGRHQ